MAPVTPLKYLKSKKMNFLIPDFLRTEGHVKGQGHMMVILIALDELYVHIFMVPILD
jgi:hypothetical protein